MVDTEVGCSRRAMEASVSVSDETSYNVITNHSKSHRGKEESHTSGMTDYKAFKPSRLVWNGHMYHRTKQEKNVSYWRCVQYTGHGKDGFACKGKVKLRNRVVKVTCKHTHGPICTNIKNYIPPSGAERAQIHKNLSAAVKGFMISSDKEILRQAKTNVQKRHKCDICHMTFAISRVCESHMMIEHMVQARWRCVECGMQFLHGRSYNQHMTLRHRLTPHVCNVDGCGAVFRTKSLLKKHRQGHQKMVLDDEGNLRKEKPVYKCPHCPAEFPHPSKMSYHMRIHTGERPFKCHLCSRSFRCASHRTTHIKSAHTKARQHLCNWCGKKFCTASALKSHVNMHTGEKPYSCPVCSRPFSKKYAMIVHIRQHTGEKPYVCDQCGQSFTVRVSLRSHLKSKHGIVVDTSMYRRLRDPADSSIPHIGRPRREDSEKQLLMGDETGQSEKGAPPAAIDCSTGNLDSASLATFGYHMGENSNVFPTAPGVNHFVANGLMHSVPKRELHAGAQGDLQLRHEAMLHAGVMPGLKTESYNQEMMLEASLSAYSSILLPRS